MDLQGSVIQDGNALADLRAAEGASMLPFAGRGAKQTHLDELIVLQPGDVRFGVAEGNAGQHSFGLHQQGQVGGVALDLRLW